MNIIKYFFLRIYSASLSSGENDWGWAFTLVSIFLFANIYSFLDIVLIVTHTKLPEVNNVFIISLGGIVLYFIYVFLIKIQKAQKSINEFHKMERRRKTKLDFLLLIYIMATISLFICTGKIIRNLNR